jgi:hypothetical protein
MPENTCDRREILNSLLAGLPLLSWDWNAFPRGDQDKTPPGAATSPLKSGIGASRTATSSTRAVFTLYRGPSVQPTSSYGRDRAFS